MALIEPPEPVIAEVVALPKPPKQKKGKRTGLRFVWRREISTTGPEHRAQLER